MMVSKDIIQSALCFMVVPFSSVESFFGMVFTLIETQVALPG
jgi:hypothetical protein